MTLIGHTCRDHAPVHLSIVDANPDPTGTSPIRRSMARDLDARWRKLKMMVNDAVVKQDLLRLATAPFLSRPGYAAYGDVVMHFSQWLAGAIEQTVLQDRGEWVRPYVRQAVELSISRTTSITGRQAVVSEDRVIALGSAMVTELQGIAAAVLQQASRSAMQSIVAHFRPTRAARVVNMVVRSVGQRRGELLAEFACVKSFNSATLDSLRNFGHRRVGIIPEALPKVRDAKFFDASKKYKNGKFKKPTAYQIGKAQKAEKALQALQSVNVLTAGDDHVCPICEGIAENGPYEINEAESLIPAHPHAVLEGTTITPYDSMHEMVVAKFRGPAIHVRTSSKFTTIGPHHPMLTRRGFVEAHLLRKGDQLLYDSRTERSFSATSSRSYFKEMPLAQDAFETLLSNFTSIRASSTELDLHGDGVFCEREIEAVHPTRQLLPVLDPCGIEHLTKVLLARSNSDLLLKTVYSLLKSHTNRVFSSAFSIMSSLNLIHPFIPSHPGPLDELLFRRGSSFDSSLSQHRVNPRSRFVQSLRDRKDTIPVHIGSNDSFFRWDRVLDVHVVQFSGLAYDLSTASSLYNNNGFVVKNCRCLFVPADEPTEEDEE